MPEMSGRRWPAEARVPQLTPGEFEQIRRLLHEKAGIDLRNGKEELVTARLGKKIRQSAFRSFREYYRHVLEDESGEALIELIDALTTNYTSFLREGSHFEFLRQSIVPEIRKRDSIEIWSAACATGEEPYSIAFSLLEELGDAAIPRIRILATDISSKALAAARKAVYAADRVDSVPAAWMPKYFLRGERSCRGWFRVKPEVRELVEFRRLNLTEPFEHLPRFAVIFCRNVMIYFDKPTQEDLVRRLTACLEPGGWLLTGHSESLIGSKHSLQYVRPAIYRKPDEHGGRFTRMRDGKCVH